ncbi:MAG TPA: hypothetical protein VJS92_09765 [Candidatus Polarisedimenticolaceae bacterium]|nr:hypothetical protein [Candidatus Polarisedimenticolaceae bacterium]
MTKAIVLAAMLAPIAVVLPLLLAGRPGDGRPLRRVSLGVSALTYGIIMLVMLATLLLFFALVFAYLFMAFGAHQPDEKATELILPLLALVAWVASAILFIASGVGVLLDKKWGYVGTWIALILYLLFFGGSLVLSRGGPPASEGRITAVSLAGRERTGRDQGGVVMSKSFVRTLVVAAVCLAATLGAVSVFTEVQAGPCRCPLIYAPVICDHDRTYPNMCVANCHHAQNCVPTGEL